MCKYYLKFAQVNPGRDNYPSSHCVAVLHTVDNLFIIFWEVLGGGGGGGGVAIVKFRIII